MPLTSSGLRTSVTSGVSGGLRLVSMWRCGGWRLERARGSRIKSFYCMAAIYMRGSDGAQKSHHVSLPEDNETKGPTGYLRTS